MRASLHQAQRDHPRGCGEKPPKSLLFLSYIGSSPRVRGKVTETSTPRTRGAGSSPRVRGKDAPTVANRQSTGIIPAGAGKSMVALPGRDRRPDHPRGCGEKCARRKPLLGLRGSSPRVRGKADTALLGPGGKGIIPAGAGKRDEEDLGLAEFEDHPRGCGEKPKFMGDGGDEKGSSPRVRGKARKSPLVSVRTGIIPAGAGKSGKRTDRSAKPRDHPRGCGEKIPRPIALAGTTGIIPAGAGKSHTCINLNIQIEDHPRGCGEKLEADLKGIPNPGSSPRVRGKVVCQR